LSKLEKELRLRTKRDRLKMILKERVEGDVSRDVNIEEFNVEDAEEKKVVDETVDGADSKENKPKKKK